MAQEVGTDTAARVRHAEDQLIGGSGRGANVSVLSFMSQTDLDEACRCVFECISNKIHYESPHRTCVNVLHPVCFGVTVDVDRDWRWRRLADARVCLGLFGHGDTIIATGDSPSDRRPRLCLGVLL